MEIDLFNTFTKCLLIYFSIYYVFIKTIDYKDNNIKKKLYSIVSIIILCVLYTICMPVFDFLITNLICFILYSTLLCFLTKNDFGYTIVVLFVALGIVIGTFMISAFLSAAFRHAFLLSISKDSILSLILIAITEIILLYFIFKIKRFKNRYFIFEK